LEAERNRDKPDGDEIQKSMMAPPSSNQGGANTKSKGTSMPWRTPSMGKRDGFRKPNMSASGLGCVKTPKLNFRTEISSRLRSI
jgi:hypothetical protein